MKYMEKDYDNHYYPKCLVKNWSTTNSIFVSKYIIAPQHPVKENPTKVSARSVLYKTGYYNYYTEVYTSREDETLRNQLIAIGQKLFNDDIEAAGSILTSNTTRCLLYKLLQRQPSLNNSLINALATEITSQPYLMASKNNPFTIPTEDNVKIVNKIANQLLFAREPSNEDYNVFTYHLVVNQSSTPFILPDDTKPRCLMLSLTPWLLMQYHYKSKLKSWYKTIPDAIITFYDANNIINQYNHLLQDNCDRYYITADK